MKPTYVVKGNGVYRWNPDFPSAAEQTRAVADAYAMLFGVGLVLGAAVALWAGRKR